MKRKNNVVFLTRSAAIAAIYVVLTYLSYIFGLSSGALQVRLSEMLCVLPIFFPEAVIGLPVGCFIANLATSSPIWDTVFGTLATLIGAFGARLISKRRALHPIAPLPNVLANTMIIPFVLKYSWGVSGALPLLVLSVGVGEIFSAWVLGLVLLGALKKSLFKN